MSEIESDAIINSPSILSLPGATRRQPLIAYGIVLIFVGIGVTLFNLFVNGHVSIFQALLPLMVSITGGFIFARGLRLKKV
jgi:membrane associated rhomboid family serine protease